MQAKLIYTCNGHERATERIFPTMPRQGANLLEVSPESYSGFYGFGLGITPSSCYELSLMEPTEREKLLRHLYSKEGLGLSVGRLCIGSCDYSPEMYSYDDVDGDVALEHFSIARDEEYVIPMLKEIVRINPDIYFLASPWSPPFWMKTGRSMCGGYMRDQYLECYSEYILKFIRAYAAHGIKISALTAQNELNCQKEANMPTCIWHPETEAKFLRIMHEKLKANGLDVKLWLYDHNFDDTDRVLWSLDACDGLRDICSGVAFHYYVGTVEQTKLVKKKYPDIELHFTEGGPRLSESYATDWCKWGLMIVKCLKVGYQSFMGFNVILNELGGPNIGPHINICAGFVTLDNRNFELSYSGQYKAFAHIAPYVTPESKISAITVADNFDLQISHYPEHFLKIEGALIENPDGKKIAVIVNPNSCGMQSQIEIGGQYWYVELEANSVNTVIVE